MSGDRPRFGRRGRKPGAQESLFGAVALVAGPLLATASAIAAGIHLDLLEDAMWIAWGPLQLLWGVPLYVHANATRRKLLARAVWIAVTLAFVGGVAGVYVWLFVW